MLFLNMTDLVGNYGIDLFGFQQLQQGRGYQNVAKFFDEPHDTGGHHSAAENGPVKDIGIGHSRSLTQVFDPTSMIPGFEGFAAPKFLYQRRADDGHAEKKKKKVGDFSFSGIEKLLGKFKGQAMDDIGNSGQEQPGQQNGN